MWPSRFAPPNVLDLTMETCDEIPAAPKSAAKQPSPFQPDSILMVGSQSLAAAISGEEERDDSSVHVLVLGSPAFWADDTGMLQTPEADIEVRVCNIVRIEEEDEDLESSQPVFRIGLDQLENPPVKLRPRPAQKRRRKQSHAYQLLSGDSTS